MSIKMHCSVYHDERIVPNKWLYHGLLFIPVKNETQVLELLSNARLATDCNSVIHFHDLRDTAVENQLAEAWIDFFCNELSTMTYFYFIGIDLTKLAQKLWPSHRGDKIYNRFFQIGLYGGIKWFFLNKEAGFYEVDIHKIFSHTKSRHPRDRFRTQAVEDIMFKSASKEENICFENPEIIEISDDHREDTATAEKCQIIQYVDLIIGTLSQTFDYTSQHLGKCIVADKLCANNLPFEILYTNKPNFRSYFYKKYAVSFFPRDKIPELDILENAITTAKNQFYQYREAKYLRRYQGSLFGE